MVSTNLTVLRRVVFETLEWRFFQFWKLMCHRVRRVVEEWNLPYSHSNVLEHIIAEVNKKTHAVDRRGFREI